MTFKSLLLPYAEPDACQSMLQAAILLARGFDSHLAALHAQRDLVPTGQWPAEVVDQLSSQQNSVRDVVSRLARDAREHFLRSIGQADFGQIEQPDGDPRPTASWQVVAGEEPACVSERGGAYDLIIVGRPISGGTPSRATLEAALFGTGRPVLMAPPSAPKSIGERIVIGWNCSVPSARAVGTAMPLLRRAQEVAIVMVATGAKRGPPPQDIADQLAWHGVNATVRVLDPDYRRVGEALLDEARERAADLLVIGSYSQSRLRELILGGVTRDILSAAEIPVFMNR